MPRSPLILLMVALGVLLLACPTGRGRGGGGGDDDDDDSASTDDDDAQPDDDDVQPDDDDVQPDDDDVQPDDDDVQPDDDDAGDDDDAVQPPQPGDVFVTELMLDPTAVYDADGEWVELRNMTASAIDLSGWELADGGSDYVVISPDAPLTLAANGHLVLGKSTSASVNGGVSVAWAYGTSITLSNSDDEVILSRDDGQVMFSLAYTASNWSVEPGISNQLSSGVNALSAAQSTSNWCIAWSAPTYGLGDYGTPGAANPYCAAE